MLSKSRVEMGPEDILVRLVPTAACPVDVSGEFADNLRQELATLPPQRKLRAGSTRIRSGMELLSSTRATRCSKCLVLIILRTVADRPHGLLAYEAIWIAATESPLIEMKEVRIPMCSVGIPSTSL
jgi:hypothetical protein